MHIKALGHVILKVRDRARTEAFYNGILGLPNAARMDDHDMTFFSIGTDMKDLLQAKVHLEAAGVRIRPIDHDVTKSLYFSDPDDNGIEVYVDVSDAWKDDPQLIAQIKPLDL
jgi:catechol 2,3-dioxygenase